MRLAFWTWVVDRLDAMRLYARTRKMQAISDMLMTDYKPFPADKTYDANIAKAFGNYERN